MRFTTLCIRYAFTALALTVHTGTAFAEGPETKTLSAWEEALRASKPILDAVIRYEHVAQDGIAENADALTYRIRAGVETGKLWETSLLIEFDHVQDLAGDFNSTINGKTVFPIVADPNATEINRFQLTNTSLPETRITLGRQRIILDNARFIGNVGWRQNEQTFDALRVENTSIKGLTLDAAYIDQVNRIFGDDSPAGRWESDSWLVNGRYDLPLKGAQASIGGFSYLLDFENAAAASSQTFGVHASLARGFLSLKGAYAAQSDYGAQTVDYNADYYMVEGGVAKGGFSAGVGYEVLTGDGVVGFSTPLATLHAFNGWADVFLATPADGLKDVYGSLGYKKKHVGPFSLVNFTAAYHDFSAEATDADYGSEVDLLAVGKINRFTVLAKAVFYNTDGFATEREKFWLQLAFAL